MSDLGSLSSCMLENDAEARNRARKLRQKALVASIVFEAALIGAMLLWPLITPGVLTGRVHRHARAAISRRRRRCRKTPALERASAGERYSHAARLPDVCTAGSSQSVRALSNDAAERQHRQRARHRRWRHGRTAGRRPDNSRTGIGDAKPPIDIHRPSPPPHSAPLHMSEGVMEAVAHPQSAAVVSGYRESDSSWPARFACARSSPPMAAFAK